MVALEMVGRKMVGRKMAAEVDVMTVMALAASKIVLRWVEVDRI